MNNEKILFKCTLKKSKKDLKEGFKIVLKKRIIISKIVFSLVSIIIAMSYIYSFMYNEDLFLIDALGVFFSSKRIITEYILIILFIWKFGDILIWINCIKIKNYEKSFYYVDFYETFFEHPVSEKSSSRLQVTYSDITNFFITKNLYILCIYMCNDPIYTIFIRKDSFIEKNEQNFIKFIKSKIISNENF
ncbi:MAG: hypothetical protein ACERKV_04155 [Clostridiaceae bacterium]